MLIFGGLLLTGALGSLFGAGGGGGLFSGVIPNLFGGGGGTGGGAGGGAGGAGGGSTPPVFSGTPPLPNVTGTGPAGGSWVSGQAGAVASNIFAVGATTFSMLGILPGANIVAGVFPGAFSVLLGGGNPPTTQRQVAPTRQGAANYESTTPHHGWGIILQGKGG